MPGCAPAWYGAWNKCDVCYVQAECLGESKARTCEGKKIGP